MICIVPYWPIWAILEILAPLAMLVSIRYHTNTLLTVSLDAYINIYIYIFIEEPSPQLKCRVRNAQACGGHVGRKQISGARFFIFPLISKWKGGKNPNRWQFARSCAFCLRNPHLVTRSIFSAYLSRCDAQPPLSSFLRRPDLGFLPSKTLCLLSPLLNPISQTLLSTLYLLSPLWNPLSQTPLLNPILSLANPSSSQGRKEEERLVFGFSRSVCHFRSLDLSHFLQQCFSYAFLKVHFLSFSHFVQMPIHCSWHPKIIEQKVLL